MNFRDQTECYQAIGVALANAAPEQWAEIRANIRLDAERLDAVVSYKMRNSAEVGYLAGVPMLARYFHELARLVSTKDKGLFKECELTLLSSGEYDARFKY